MENLTLQEMSKVQKKVSFVNLFTKNFKVDSIGNYSETEHENSILENISSLVCGGFPRNFDENLNEEKCILKNKDYIDAISRCYEKSNNVEPLIKFSRSTMISVIYELARNTSQNINYEKISRNINISSKTFKKYIDILMEMHLIYELNP
jgi:predicted AAA+ superfamily ATPase